MVDCDLVSHRTSSGCKAMQLVLLPDADVSDPDNESESDYGGQHDEDSSDEGLSSQGSSNVTNRKNPTVAQRQTTSTAGAQKPSKFTHAFTW